MPFATNQKMTLNTYHIYIWSLAKCTHSPTEEEERLKLLNNEASKKVTLSSEINVSIKTLFLLAEILQILV